MTPSNISIRTLLVLTALTLTACPHTKPIPNRTMDFGQGMQRLAGNLADQLENSSIGNKLNKIVINPLTKQKQLKKIVVDPFINVESGYPVKVNARIAEIMAREIGKRFQVTGELEPENLEISEYILNGTVTQQGEQHRVNSTVFEKATGKVLASASVNISGFDTTPLDIYKDSPVFLKGKNYEQHIASVARQPDQTVNSDYNRRLVVKALLVKGDSLYEQKEFKKSLGYYNQAAEKQGGDQLDVLNGQFVNLIKDGKPDDAEAVYARLLRTSIAETSDVANKIVFAPNARSPIESKAGIYRIYTRQIARLVALAPACKVTIVGHSSRTGTEGYNDKLSLQRAQWIQKEMASIFPNVKGKTETIGRGFRENLVGTGRDDLTDEIDRRVEFRFKGCGEY